MKVDAVVYKCYHSTIQHSLVDRDRLEPETTSLYISFILCLVLVLGKVMGNMNKRCYVMFFKDVRRLCTHAHDFFDARKVPLYHVSVYEKSL